MIHDPIVLVKTTNRVGIPETEVVIKHSHTDINIPVFQICGRNNKTSLVLYGCEMIYLINNGAISPYVQE